MKLEKRCILHESLLFVCIYKLNSHLKWSFKSINTQIFSLFFVCSTWNVYRSAPVPRNLPCPRKLLIALLFTDEVSDVVSLWNHVSTTQQANTCTNSAIETLEKYLENVKKLKTPKRRQWHRSGVSIVILEHIPHILEHISSIFSVAFEQVDVFWESLLWRLLLWTIYNQFQ